MFQESEIIVLIVAVFASLLLWYLARGAKTLILPRIIYFGFAWLVCAYVSTVVEGAFLEDFFNTVEHASYVISGICFAAGFRHLDATLGWHAGADR